MKEVGEKICVPVGGATILENGLFQLSGAELKLIEIFVLNSCTTYVTVPHEIQTGDMHNFV